jgi:hypothetical protein
MQREVIMNCLECATTTPMTYMVRGAISFCAYCGAGICLDHARFVDLPAHPVGLAAPPPSGARRILCTACHAAPAYDGADFAALTAPAGHGERSAGGGLAAFVSALMASAARIITLPGSGRETAGAGF